MSVWQCIGIHEGGQDNQSRKSLGIAGCDLHTRPPHFEKDDRFIYIPVSKMMIDHYSLTDGILILLSMRVLTV